MEKFLLVMRLLVQLLPVLIDIIKTVETAIPGAGKGEQKLAMVREMMEAAYSYAGIAAVKFDEVWPTIQRLITSIVTTYNSVGIFKK